MTDEYRRGPALERESLPANAQRHVQDARSSIPKYTPRRYSLGVTPPVADSQASMALARELSAAYAAEHHLPSPFVPVIDAEGNVTGYTFVPRPKEDPAEPSEEAPDVILGDELEQECALRDIEDQRTQTIQDANLAAAERRAELESGPE